jgi:predicted acylesterase/phospholipase RssA
MTERVEADRDPSSGGAPPAELGIALSGGGVRAALFSLGVLVGVVELGQNHRVRQIASVSGGSLVNAAVAQSGDFTQFGASGATERDNGRSFHGPSERIATMLARRGAFVFSWSTAVELIKLAARVFTPSVSVGVVAYFVVAGILEDRDLSGVPWLWVAGVLIVITLMAVVNARGRLQELLFAARLAESAESRSMSKARLDELSKSGTNHVLVATDLVSGNPVYFARDFVCCPAFGWGRPGNLRTATAVYCSSAFPGVFPARRIKRRNFDFQAGRAVPPFPRWLKLSDGGIYNNLGTDWFDELNAQAMSSLWAFGGRDDLLLQPVGRQVIVNAGAASGGFRRVPPMLALRRTMTVLYDNTVRPRIAYLTKEATRHLDTSPLVIDIKESPFHMARRLSDARGYEHSDGEREQACIGRARALTLRLGSGPGEQYWLDFARQTSNTKTKLTRAGVESGARMLMHGYLSCLVAFHVLEGASLPDHILGEDYFLKLAGRERIDPVSSANSEHDAIESDASTLQGANAAVGGAGDEPASTVALSPSAP